MYIQVCIYKPQKGTTKEPMSRVPRNSGLGLIMRAYKQVGFGSRVKPKPEKNITFLLFLRLFDGRPRLTGVEGILENMTVWLSHF